MQFGRRTRTTITTETADALDNCPLNASEDADTDGDGIWMRTPIRTMPVMPISDAVETRFLESDPSHSDSSTVIGNDAVNELGGGTDPLNAASFLDERWRWRHGCAGRLPSKTPKPGSSLDTRTIDGLGDFWRCTRRTRMATDWADGLRQFVSVYAADIDGEQDDQRMRLTARLPVTSIVTGDENTDGLGNFGDPSIGDGPSAAAWRLFRGRGRSRRRRGHGCTVVFH